MPPTGDASAVKPLIEFLTDENREVRESAIRVLGMLEDSRAVTMAPSTWKP